VKERKDPRSHRK